jgi:hypothetical protein
MSRDRGGNGIQEVVSSILIGSTNSIGWHRRGSWRLEDGGERLRYAVQTILGGAGHTSLDTWPHLAVDERGRGLIESRFNRGDLDENFIGAPMIDDHLTDAS